MLPTVVAFAYLFLPSTRHAKSAPVHKISRQCTGLSASQPTNLPTQFHEDPNGDLEKLL